MKLYHMTQAVSAAPFSHVNVVGDAGEDGSLMFTEVHVEGRDEPMSVPPTHPDDGPEPGDMIVDMGDVVLWMRADKFEEMFREA